MMTSKLQ